MLESLVGKRKISAGDIVVFVLVLALAIAGPFTPKIQLSIGFLGSLAVLAVYLIFRGNEQQ